MAQCNVSVASRNGSTVLRVRSSVGLAGIPTYLPAFLLSFIVLAGVGTGMDASTPVKTAIILGVMFLAFLAANLCFRSIVRKSNERAAEATDRAAQKLSEALTREGEALRKSIGGVSVPASQTTTIDSVGGLG